MLDWTAGDDDQLRYLVSECNLHMYRAARIMRRDLGDVSDRCKELNICKQQNRQAQWPPVKDHWFVKVQFEDIDAATLAAEKRKNPGVIFAVRPSGLHGRSALGGQMATFVR